MRSFLLSALAVVTWASSMTALADIKSGSEQPNIVVIIVDDLGYSDLSSYRTFRQDSGIEFNSTSHTPNIDQLANQGMMFTDFYSGAAVCSPSRAGLLTGRNPVRVGMYNYLPPQSPMHLRSEEVTMAEVFRAEGYRTGHFGKWHLTSGGMEEQPTPVDQGFDYEFYTHNNAEPSHRNPENFIRNGKALGKLQGYSSHLVVNEAIDWLKKDEQSDKPFYINLWFHEPHENNQAPEYIKQRHQRLPRYFGAIENMDLAVGKFLNYLEFNELDDNTIVVFSSDNGSEKTGSNVPLRGEKVFNYEGGVRVPFIIKWPNHVPSNTSSSVEGSLIDLLPSLTSMANVDFKPENVIDGEDISTVFTNQEAVYHRSKPIFFYRYFHEPVSMIREGKWVLLGYNELVPYKEDYDHVDEAKLKPGPGEKPGSMWAFQPKHMDYIKTQNIVAFELYDMENDPGQKINVAHQHPELVNKLKQKMLKLKTEMVLEGGDWFQK